MLRQASRVFATPNSVCCNRITSEYSQCNTPSCGRTITDFPLHSPRFGLTRLQQHIDSTPLCLGDERTTVTLQYCRKFCFMWDSYVVHKTNEQVRRTVANSPTMDSLMETRSRCRWLCKLSLMKESRSPRRMLGAWCTTPQPVGRPQQTIRHAYISTLKKLGFEGEKGQLREWMTVARDRSAWARKVEYKLLLPPGSFTNLRRH
jgi:hypothetical protein